MLTQLLALLKPDDLLSLVFGGNDHLVLFA
jgi:hypothetical protein